MTAKLVLATGNAGKISELRAALSGFAVDLYTPRDLHLGPAPAETGFSYEENALIKAAHASHAAGMPALADDSGIEVDALAGAPGIYSARFGGRLGDGERIAHLLQRLRDVPEQSRGAAFVSVLVLARPDGQVRSFAGSCRGRILLGPRGEGGHGYDPIFWSPELQKTFAEASEQEKSTVSHRGKAMRQLLAWLHENRGWLEQTGDSPAHR